MLEFQRRKLNNNNVFYRSIFVSDNHMMNSHSFPTMTIVVLRTTVRYKCLNTPRSGISQHTHLVILFLLFVVGLQWIQNDTRHSILPRHWKNLISHSKAKLWSQTTLNWTCVAFYHKWPTKCWHFHLRQHNVSYILYATFLSARKHGKIIKKLSADDG